MSNKGSLIILVGPSGSGKGTVLKKLLETEKNTFLSVSATTRKPRVGEEDGVNYLFITKDKFQTLILSDSMLEYACYVGNYYGTPKATVLNRINNGENVILEIEVQGAKQIKKMYPTAILIFIIPPSLSELKKRLTDRNTEDTETINARLATALDEVCFANQCDYVVINDEVDNAVSEIHSIIQASRCRLTIMQPFIETILEEQK